MESTFGLRFLGSFLPSSSDERHLVSCSKERRLCFRSLIHPFLLSHQDFKEDSDGFFVEEFHWCFAIASLCSFQRVLWSLLEMSFAHRYQCPMDYGSTNPRLYMSPVFLLLIFWNSKCKGTKQWGKCYLSDDVCPVKQRRSLNVFGQVRLCSYRFYSMYVGFLFR